MIVYKVTGDPILVRKTPSPDGRIINVVPKDGNVYAAAEENGWIRTTAGNYVFRTDDLTASMDATAVTLTQTRNMLRAAGVGGGGGSFDDDTNWIEDSFSGVERSSSYNTSDRVAAGSASEQRKQDNISYDYSQSNVTVIVNSTTTVMVPKNDGSGEWIKIKTPEDLTKDNNDSVVNRVDSTGNIYITSNGQEFKIDGGSGGVKISNKVGENGENLYDPFVLSEKQKEERDAENFVTELTRSFQTLVNRDALQNTWSKMKVDEIRSIFGMPYQFLPTTDPRIASTIGSATSSNKRDGSDPLNLKGFGRKFAEKILARAPIMVIQPGEAVFLRGYSQDVKAKVASSVANLISDANETNSLESMLDGNGEYYSFKIAKEEYYKAVNTACRAVAIFMGLDKVVIPGLSSITKSVDNALGTHFSKGNTTSLGNFNWGLNTPFALDSYYAGALQFYINSETQVAENLSTDTRMSQLASRINQYSDQAAEAMFIMGGVHQELTKNNALGGATGLALETKDATKNKSAEAASGAGMLPRILGSIGNILSGGRMHFPELWADSHFARSYNVTIRLDSPDSDALSIYLNIFVPLIHLLALSMPISAGNNTYVAPFMVRAFYKSMFHIDMGIIQSCDIQKGDQGAWTQSGLPTQVIVNLSIKDLYTVMSQSRGEGNNTLLSNPAQLDYLANTCGVNVAPANFARSLALWYMLKGTNRATDAFMASYGNLITSIWAVIQNTGTNTRWRM